MEVKRERYPYCVVLDFMVHYFKNEWRWDVDIKDTFDIYTKTIISLGSKSTLGSTTKKLEFGDDKKLDLVRTNVSFYYDVNLRLPCLFIPLAEDASPLQDEVPHRGLEPSLFLGLLETIICYSIATPSSILSPLTTCLSGQR